jgi:hypothetical protein
MFGNNKVINNIYNKMNEYDSLKAEIYSRRSAWYLIVFILSTLLALMVMTGSFDVSVRTQGLTVFICMPIIAFSAIFATHTDTIDAGYWFWPKSNKVLEQKKQEVIDYIAKEETQVEIINFNFGSVDEITVAEITVTELKKSLALKDYSRAYRMLSGILPGLVSLENIQLTEAQTKKLIAEYELDLKMKL